MRPHLVALYQFACPWVPLVTGKVRGRTIVLDNLRIRNAEVVDCTIYYGGGSAEMVDNSFTGCKFIFFGKAANAYILSEHVSGRGNEIQRRLA